MRPVITGVLAALWIAWPAAGQELEPRAYRTLPTGISFVIFSYTHSQGNVLVDAASPIQDLEITLATTAVGLLRSFGIAGRSASLSVLMPYAFISGSAEVGGERRSDGRSGMADMRLRLAVNLLGGPALTPQEYARYRQRRNVGVSLTAVPPTGQYDPTRLINFGSNRWGFKPEIGYSSVRGRWLLEIAGGVWIFTDNDNFLGGRTLHQDPIGSVQGHLSYTFEGGIWLALDGNYYSGGRTTLDGDLQADLQRNSRIGVTLSLPLAKRHSIRLSAHSGAFTRIGADFDQISLSYFVRWPDLAPRP